MAVSTTSSTVMNNVEAVRATLYESDEKRRPHEVILGEETIRNARGNVFPHHQRFHQLGLALERVIDTLDRHEASISRYRLVGMAMEGLRPIAEIPVCGLHLSGAFKLQGRRRSLSEDALPQQR